MTLSQRVLRHSHLGKAKQVTPIHTGHIIVSTWQPHGMVVQQTIQDMGLASQVIMNKKSELRLNE